MKTAILLAIGFTVFLGIPPYIMFCMAYIKHFFIYRKILKKFEKHPVTIRMVHEEVMDDYDVSIWITCHDNIILWPPISHIVLVGMTIKYLIELLIWILWPVVKSIGYGFIWLIGLIYAFLIYPIYRLLTKCYSYVSPTFNRIFRIIKVNWKILIKKIGNIEV